MDGLEFLIPIFGILLVMIPVAGLTLILTARFALKPLAETIAEALRESRGGARAEAEIEELTERVALLSEQVARLERTQQFDRSLGATRS